MKSIRLGLRRHPLRCAGSIFLAYSVLWTLTESIAFFNPTLSLRGFYSYFAFIILSIAIGIVMVYQPRRVAIKVDTSDTLLTIYYGDIFEQDGYIAIPVNEFFDSELGEPVSANSLHGMVIKRYFGGYRESFDQAISSDLRNVSFETVEREQGNSRKYAIGTTARVAANDRRFLLFALSHTNIETRKAGADLSTTLEAMHGLFQRARDCTGGDKLVLPLVGSGLSGVGLPATQLLQLVVLAIIDETKKQQICKNIDVVLHVSRFEEIDLEAIRSQWS